MDGSLMRIMDIELCTQRESEIRPKSVRSHGRWFGIWFAMSLISLLACNQIHSASLPRSASLVTRLEIADPCLGFHWRLIVDPSKPGAPGQLVLVDQNHPGESHESAITVDHPRAEKPGIRVQPFLIRAGAPVVVFQDTGTVHARLNAIALEPAALGQRLRVRLVLVTGLSKNKALTSSGSVISTEATAPGEVRWVDSIQLGDRNRRGAY